MKSHFYQRALVAVGAIFASVGVGLSAYAAHVAEGADRVNLQSAALFTLAHGIALTALSRQTPHRLGMFALSMLAIGVMLFSGSLVAAHFFATPTRLAPVGGSLLILGWLLYAVDAFRR